MLASLSRRTRLAPLAMLSCVRASTLGGPATSSALSRALLTRAAPASQALWARLRAGDAANMTTAAVSDAPIIVATRGDFEEALKGAGDQLVIVDFTATWCGPCKMIGPVFDALAAEYKGKAVFLKVDVDENAETAQDCGIRAMPTFQFYKNNAKLAEFAGADKAKLLELLKANV
ncbi:thioredoxin-like protein [Pavlovales sp. CCMP2436]|nr:thioredoxin-like protein [Pavlovales sp. CCMP2436]